MNTAKVTNSDRAAVVRDGWRRAYGLAIAACEPVRLHLGEAFRAAWAAFRQARAEGSVVAEQTAEYEEQYGRSDRAEARAYLAAMLVEKAAQKAAAVEDHWSTYGPAAGAGARLDDEDSVCDLDEGAESPAAPVQLDIVAWIAAQPAMVPQPVQQQQAQAAAPAPDLTTAEGLAQILVGRTAKLPLQMGEPDYTVTGVSRWTSPDGSRVRDYIALETTGQWNDDRKGPTGLFIDRAGGGRGGKLETKAGTARWGYGKFCNSGTKEWNADALIKELLSPILDD